MTFSSMYRISLYTMLVLSALVLSADAAAEDSFALLHPIAVAIAGVVAFLTVDRNPARGLSRGLANMLAIASVALVWLEYSYDENRLALALGHWLIYLAMIQMFLPKSIKDDWYLFLLGLVQVVVGGFLSQSDQAGILLALWALSALWALGLFHLHREAMRNGRTDPSAVGTRPREPYPGLIDRPFLFASMRVAAITLTLGGLIFLVMPRWSATAVGAKAGPVARHLTGFSDQVRLGQIGEILENDTIVMTVQLFDENERRIITEPDTEYRWRGVALSVYKDGVWRRDEPSGSIFNLTDSLPIGKKVIHQRITLEPTGNPYLFGLRPILQAWIGNDAVDVFGDGTMTRPRAGSRRLVSMEYNVISAADGDLHQDGEWMPNPIPQLGSREGDEGDLMRPRRARGRFEQADWAGTLWGVYLEIPDSHPGFGERLTAIAEGVVADIPPDRDRDRAEALERYLSNPAHFTYSLQMDRPEPGVDPVEDFLVKRRRGHCEYFASALALLLRSIGIPARIVNGFKGGDWNTLTSDLNVRQKHAHSWVEALVSGKPNGPPLWLTLDPSPPQQRDQVVAQVGSGPLSSQIRTAGDLLRHVWIFYIVGYNADRQKAFLYDPARRVAQMAGRGFAMMGQGLRLAAEWLLNFPDVRSFFSLRGFVVSVVAMLLMVGLFRMLLWLGRRLGWRLRPGVEDGALAGVAFYRRLSDLLASCGLRRPSTETPREFARRAGVFLLGRDGGRGSIAEVPSQVVEAFYRVRFGRESLATEDLRLLESRLDALEASLRPSSQ